MSLFVEVTSVEKGCPVIINIENVIEISPLKTGGCALFISDAAAVGGKTAIKVTEDYSMFKQFVVQPVSVEDVAKKVKSLKSAASTLEIPKL